MAIGIEASGKKNTDRIYTNAGFPHYAFKSYNCKSDINDPYHQYGEQFDKGDVVRMELDMTGKSISFYINDKSQGVAFDNLQFPPDRVYNLAIYGHDKNCSIQLLSFTQQ